MVPRYIYFFTLVLSGCQFHDDTKPKIISVDHHPFKDYKAVFFLKPGNAATNDSYHVSVLKKSAEINEKSTGNVFIGELIESHSGNPVTASFEMNGVLEIVYHESLEKHKNENYFFHQKDTIVVKYIP